MLGSLGKIMLRVGECDGAMKGRVGRIMVVRFGRGLRMRMRVSMGVERGTGVVECCFHLLLEVFLVVRGLVLLKVVTWKYL